MKLLRTLPLAVALAVATPAAAGSIQVPPKKSKAVIYDQITLAQLQDLMLRRGVEFETLSQPAKSTTLRFNLSGLVVLLVMGDGGSKTATDLYFYTVFQFEKPVDPALLNAWNLGARFSRAYVDPEGQAVLESDLRMVGGVTEAAIIDFIETYERTVSDYAKHIGFR